MAREKKETTQVDAIRRLEKQVALQQVTFSERMKQIEELLGIASASITANTETLRVVVPRVRRIEDKLNGVGTGEPMKRRRVSAKKTATGKTLRLLKPASE